MKVGSASNEVLRTNPRAFTKLGMKYMVFNAIGFENTTKKILYALYGKRWSSRLQTLVKYESYKLH